MAVDITKEPITSRPFGQGFDGTVSKPEHPPIARKPAETPPPPVVPRSMIMALQDMARRDNDDYAELINSLRHFAAQKRADLEAFERLLGTK